MKLIRVIDGDTGKLVEEFKCRDFNLQYTDTDPQKGYMRTVRRIENAVFGPKHRIRNEYYRPIAEQIITKFDELKHINPKRILFIEDEKWEPRDKKRTWIARVGNANAWLANTWGYHYVMEFRRHFTEKLTAEQIVALVYHELLHIDVDGELRKHDIEDWDHMVATLGSNWGDENSRIKNILDDDFDWSYLRKSRGQVNLFDFEAAKHKDNPEMAAKTGAV